MKPTRIYVRKDRIEENRRRKTPLPVIEIEHGDGSKEHGNVVRISGPSEVVYHHDKDRFRCVIETTSHVDCE